MAKRKVAAAGKTSPMKPGAKKDKVNKSQAIRDYVADHPAEGPTAVSKALKKQGIDVSATFVSNITSGDRRKNRKRIGKRSRPKAAPPKAASATPSDDKVSMSTLLKAKRLAEQMGGVGQAKSALDALAKLVG